MPLVYATSADMIARFGELELIQLTDVDNVPPSVVDVDRVTLKLADAAAFVDGYVGQVYKLPLRGCRKPPVAPAVEPEYVAPPVLTRLTCDVARYYLHTDLAPENEVYRRFKAATAELERIAAGNALLACPWGGSAGDLVASDRQQGDQTFYSFSDRPVTDDTTKGFA
jgi:phage gp36-like protein